MLDRIVPVSELTTGLKFLAYGRQKSGKTRFACTFPKPLCILGTEDGTKSVLGVQGIDFVKLERSEEVGELVEHFRSGGKYNTVVLDHAGGLQDLILKEVLNLDAMPVQRSWGMAERSDWMVVGAQWKERVSKLIDLADTIGTNVVIIAHERNFNDEGKTSDVMLPSIGAAVSPTVANFLHASVDYIGHVFIREQTATKVRTVGEGKLQKQITTEEKTGRKEHCLRVGAHEIFTTGFRLPPGKVLPDVIVDPTYEKVHELIYGD